MIQTNAAFLAAPNAFSNHKTCVNKRSIPDRGHTVHRYLLEAKAKNTIKLSRHENKPWLLGCFSKDLIIITQPKPTKKKPPSENAQTQNQSCSIPQEKFFQTKNKC
jgi:hypothetical protein